MHIYQTHEIRCQRKHDSIHQLMNYRELQTNKIKKRL